MHRSPWVRRVVPTALALVVALASSCSSGDSPGGAPGLSSSTDRVSERWDPASGTVVLLADDPNQPPDAVLPVRSYDQDLSATVFALGRFDGATGALTWTSEGFGDDAYDMVLTTDDTRVFVAIEEQVRALDLTDGTTLWTHDLTDVIDRPCVDCLASVGGTLVATSYDGYLHGLDPDTGESRWSRRLEDPSGSARPIGSDLLVFDRSEAGDATTFVVSATTGRDIGRLPVECRLPEIGYGSVPGPDTLVEAVAGEPGVADLGFGYSPACWQRWNAVEATMRWEALLPDNSVGTSDAPSVTADRILAAGQDEVVAVDRSTGEVTRVREPLDLDLQPIDLVDGTLVASARSTRGTTRFRLLGLDARTSSVRWERPLGDATPAAGPDADPSSLTGEGQRFVTYTLDDALFVVTLQATEASSGDPTYRLGIDELDMTDGQPIDASSTELGTLGFSTTVEPLGVSGRFALVSLGDRVLVLDLVARQVVSSGL